MHIQYFIRVSTKYWLWIQRCWTISCHFGCSRIVMVCQITSGQLVELRQALYKQLSSQISLS